MPDSIATRAAELVGRLRRRLGDQILTASAARDPSDSGLLWMLGMLQEAAIGTLLEIGTCHGLSAALLASVCERVTTIDVADFWPHPGDAGGATAFAWVSRVLEIADVQNVWPVLAKNEAEKQRIVSRLRFDAAFLDGLHTEAGVCADFELVRRCGFVFFHNAHTQAGVARFLTRIEPLERCGDFALWRHTSG